MKRDFLSILDLSEEEIKRVIDDSVKLKRGLEIPRVLEGKNICLIFEKPSLRTRVTFEVAISKLGGNPIYLSKDDIQLGVRESVEDVARNLAKWVDGIVARVFRHENLIKLKENFPKPVINALSDLEHPCQALADFTTIFEIKHTFKVNLTFVGDGNNVATSLMLTSAKLGTNYTLACPPGYEPPRNYVEIAKSMAEKNRSQIKIINDPKEAVREAHFIYTDVWASMGQEEERGKRLRDFRDYQLNLNLLKHAPEDSYVMHCLPAHRGEEITDEVLDSSRSLVLLQAENRLWTEIALFLMLFTR